MGDWQELGQAAAIGLLFAFLVAKLISIAIAFKEDHLRLTRSSDPTPPPPDTTDMAAAAAAGEAAAAAIPEERNSDSDWEGIESTELDEEFSAASAFVAASAASSAAKVPEEAQLRLYGLYKIATEGPCTAPQPSALKMKARAKWNAWHKLGPMPPEEAMEQYVMIVDELFPTWASGSNAKGEDVTASSSGSKGPMGPVFSSFVYEQDQENELDLDDIHVSAREGATDDVLKHLASGVSVNLKDCEGRTPLHWAVDRGHLRTVEKLVNMNADVNSQDNEGQTPLHYAVVCERRDIAELLVSHHADCHIKDEDGNSPSHLCKSDWAFMTPAN